MTEAEELEKIEVEVAELGKQLQAKRDRALAILNGRIVHTRGNRFRIEGAHVYLGGMNTKIFFEGPRLKANGERWAVARESLPIKLFDQVEPR